MTKTDSMLKNQQKTTTINVQRLVRLLGEAVEGSEAHIRALLASALPEIQELYDGWDPEDEDDDIGGGLCDSIAEIMSGAVSSDYSVCNGGQDGDDHAYLFVGLNGKVWEVDLPYHIYERGGGYNWSKIPGVVFDESDFTITPVKVTSYHYQQMFGVEESADVDSEGPHPLQAAADKLVEPYKPYLEARVNFTCRDVLKLDHLQVRRDAPKGTGTGYINDLARFADRHGLILSLRTATGDDFKGSSTWKRTSSMNRLKKFYGRAGFVSSYGKRSYRPDLGGNMHRYPRTESKLGKLQRARPVIGHNQRGGSGWVFHNTSSAHAADILQNGMNAGSFSDRPIAFGGDAWVAVPLDNVGWYSAHSYGNCIAVEPHYTRDLNNDPLGKDEDGLPIYRRITGAVAVDRHGRVVDEGAAFGSFEEIHDRRKQWDRDAVWVRT